MMPRWLSIFPTRNFAGLLFVLGAMWYAASNQNNAPAYLLLFALTSAFLVSIPHTFLNLSGLNVTTESIKPTFAGQEVSVSIEITNESRAARHGIALVLLGHNATDGRVDEIPAQQATRVTVRFPAPARGEHEIETVCLTSVYPLGFVRARRCLSATQRYLVYPKPAGNPCLPVERSNQNSGHARPTNEGDDFAGVRTYMPGESQRRIDWKAVARGQPMMTKQFTTEREGALFIDLAAAQANNLEDRLSQLALWLIEAERAQRLYGLRLPGVEIAPSLGDFHFHRCQRMLAVFK
jgi:uncharacterized protein (DUF58 family)